MSVSRGVCVLQTSVRSWCEPQNPLPKFRPKQHLTRGSNSKSFACLGVTSTALRLTPDSAQGFLQKVLRDNWTLRGETDVHPLAAGWRHRRYTVCARREGVVLSPSCSPGNTNRRLCMMEASLHPMNREVPHLKGTTGARHMTTGDTPKHPGDKFKPNKGPVSSEAATRWCPCQEIPGGAETLLDEAVNKGCKCPPRPPNFAQPQSQSSAARQSTPAGRVCK